MQQCQFSDCQAHMLPCFIIPAAMCRFMSFPPLPFPPLPSPPLLFPSLDSHIVLSRKAWGSNQPDPRAHAPPDSNQVSFRSASDYQSPYAASPGSLDVTQKRTGRSSEGSASKNQGQSATAPQAPGPLDDILGQVTDLLSQVNDILGR